MGLMFFYIFSFGIVHKYFITSLKKTKNKDIFKSLYSITGSTI